MNRIAREWEQRFIEGAKEAFEFDRRNVLALVEGAKKKAVEHKSSVDWKALQFDVSQYLTLRSQDNWRQTFTPLLEGVITDQAERWNAAFGMTFDVQNLYALQWFDDYKLTFSNYVMLTTENELNTVLQQGMYEGWSIPETQRHIGQLFDQWMTGQMSDDLDWYEERLPPYRLELIARTETMRASNAGSLQLFKNWQAPFKEWMATGDDRTRPSHMDAWGTFSRGGKVGPIPIDEPFQVNGRDMMHPGDPAGGIEETANCRCALLPSFEGPSHTGEIHDSEWASFDPNTTSGVYDELFAYWKNEMAALPPDQRAELQNYTGSLFRPLNMYLRSGRATQPDVMLKKADTISRALSKGTTRNMLAYRGGIPPNAFGYTTFDESTLSMMEGKVIQDMGFTSVSVAKQTGLNFTSFSSGECFADVRVPQGTPAAFVESITFAEGENEFVLDRGRKFRVIEAFMDADLVPGKTVPHLILEVIL